MALKFIAQALEHGPADPVGKLLLVALLEHADDKGICWPSRERLKAYSGASNATVSRKLRILEVAGWIARRQRHNASTIFRVNLARLERLQAEARRQPKVPPGFEPFEDEIAQPIENKGDAHSEHLDAHSEHLDAHSDQLNPPINPSMKPGAHDHVQRPGKISPSQPEMAEGLIVAVKTGKTWANRPRSDAEKPAFDAWARAQAQKGSPVQRLRSARSRTKSRKTS